LAVSTRDTTRHCTRRYTSNRTLAVVDDEFASIEESFNQTRQAHLSLGSRPLIVITSGSNEVDPAWQRLQTDLLTRSSKASASWRREVGTTFRTIDRTW
jgi:hypothetical protein